MQSKFKIKPQTLHKMKEENQEIKKEKERRKVMIGKKMSRKMNGDKGKICK
jgi:hypothetical protein